MRRQKFCDGWCAADYVLIDRFHRGPGGDLGEGSLDEVKWVGIQTKEP
jgi:hypothetical protein